MIDSRTILGIDPGTNILGFGVIRIDEKKHPQFVDAGVLDLRKESDPYLKLEKANSALTTLPMTLRLNLPFWTKMPR